MTDSSKALPRPESGTLVSEADALDWQSDGHGFWYKPLFEDPARRQKTWLMKIAPGASVGLHAHEEVEQVYVLEGSFSDQERSYKAGDFFVRAPGAMHSTASDEGAVIMVLYSA